MVRTLLIGPVCKSPSLTAVFLPSTPIPASSITGTFAETILDLPVALKLDVKPLLY